MKERYTNPYVIGVILGLILLFCFYTMGRGLGSSASFARIATAGVSLVALGAFWLAEKVEQKFGDKDTLPKGSPKVKRTAAGLLVLLGLILAVINPDRTVAKPAVSVIKPEKQAETVQKPPATPKTPGSTGFKILEDEGC